MTELKTLNDLNGKLILENNINQEWIIKEELKAEAVKLLKLQDKEERCQFCDWLNFFNLTEEDLKEKQK